MAGFSGEEMQGESLKRRAAVRQRRGAERSADSSLIEGG